MLAVDLLLNDVGTVRDHHADGSNQMHPVSKRSLPEIGDTPMMPKHSAHANDALPGEPRGPALVLIGSRGKHVDVLEGPIAVPARYGAAAGGPFMKVWSSGRPR